VAGELVAKTRGWPKFESCILHIGTEKTGTTSLQTAFALNHSRLEENGYFVSRVLAPEESGDALKHGSLAAISMIDEKFDVDLRRNLHVTNVEQLNSNRRDIFIRFSEEVAKARRTCHTLVLSDEHCQSRLVSHEEVLNLKNFLDHFCENYKIVVYLRPQHELAISQYGMFVANGYYDIDMLPPFPPPPGYDKNTYTNRVYFDYQLLLDRWARVFGEEAIAARIYGPNSLRGGDVVNDFTSYLSLVDGPLELPRRRNSDVTARAQAFLTNFYRCCDAAGKSETAKIRARVRNAVRACFPGPGGTPARLEVVKFLDQFADSNEAVRARWFPERKALFEVNLEKYAEVPPTFTFTSDEVIGIFLEVLQKDQELTPGPRRKH
jgi:hypothetical protein